MTIACSDLCDALESVPPWGEFACDLICAAVGVEMFLQIAEIDNPTPIYVCQVWKMCAYTPGGKVNISNVEVSPPVASPGTVLRLSMQYSVFSNTSVGVVNYELTSPSGYRQVSSKKKSLQLPISGDLED